MKIPAGFMGVIALWHVCPLKFESSALSHEHFLTLLGLEHFYWGW